MELNNKTKSLSFPLVEGCSFWFSVVFVVLAMLCYLIPNTPVFVRILTATIAPMTFTYFVGKSMFEVFRIRQFDHNGQSFKIISLTFVGVIVSSSMCYVVGTLHLFSAPFVILYVIGVLLLYLISSKFKPLKYRKRTVIPVRTFKNYVALICTSIICFFIALWIQPSQSFPYVPGWDLYTNILTVRTILNDNGISEMNLQYFPTIHYFYGMVSTVTGIDPFVLFWGSIYFLFPLGGAALFLFGYRLSNNVLVAISSGVIGVTIGASNETLGLIFPYSSTFGLIITILVNGVLSNVRDKKFIIIYLACIILVYPFALFANLIFLVGTIFIYRKRVFILSILFSIGIFLTILQFGGNYFGSIGGTKFSTHLVILILGNSYGGVKGLLMFALGLFFIFINKAFDRRYVLVLVSIVVLILVMVSGIYFVAYRLEEFMRPFVAVIAGYGLGSFSTYLGNIIHERIMNRKKRVS